MTKIIIRRKQPAAIIEGLRCLHKNEAPGAFDAPDVPDMPEVRPSVDARPIEMTEVIQWIMYEVMTRKNHVITREKFRVVLGGGIMLTNQQGWDDPRAGPRADYVNGRDIGAELPLLMKAIMNGGMYIPNHTGTVVGNEIICRPGIHGLDANSLPKTWQDFAGANEEMKRAAMMMYVKTQADLIFSRHWYFEALNYHRNPDRVSRFAQGWDGADYYGPVHIAYILRDPTPYPRVWFKEWIGRDYPDPLKYYG